MLLYAASCTVILYGKLDVRLNARMSEKRIGKFKLSRDSENEPYQFRIKFAPSGVKTPSANKASALPSQLITRLAL
jgi:hypothetical protein